MPNNITYILHVLKYMCVYVYVNILFMNKCISSKSILKCVGMSNNKSIQWLPQEGNGMEKSTESVSIENDLFLKKRMKLLMQNVKF